MPKLGLPAPRSSEVEVNGAIAQLRTFGGNGRKSVKERKRAWASARKTLRVRIHLRGARVGATSGRQEGKVRER